MKPNKENEYNVFRLLRIARNKKVTDVAQALGVTPAYIHAIEAGDRKPSAALLDKYAQVLDTDVNVIKMYAKEKHDTFERAMLWLLTKLCAVG